MPSNLQRQLTKHVKQGGFSESDSRRAVEKMVKAGQTCMQPGHQKLRSAVQVALYDMERTLLKNSGGTHRAVFEPWVFVGVFLNL